MQARTGIERWRVMLITDRHRMARHGEFATVIRATLATAPASVALHVREKDVAAATLREFASEARAAYAGPVLVNGAIDLVVPLGLEGVHLPESASLAVARAALPNAIIGVSRHAPTPVDNWSAADYLQLGPIFDTPTKRRYGPPLGLSALGIQRSVATTRPVIAVGGITAANASQAFAAGASAVAVIGAVWDAPDPQRALLELLARVTA